MESLMAAMAIGLNQIEQIILLFGIKLIAQTFRKIVQATYTSISQRTDFYGWYAGKIDAKGFDNNWPGAAYIVAGQISWLDNPLVGWWVGEDVVNFGNAGNKAIFNDVFDDLKVCITDL
jgi:hypothetical protein